MSSRKSNGLWILIIAITFFFVVANAMRGAQLSKQDLERRQDVQFRQQSATDSVLAADTEKLSALDHRVTEIEQQKLGERMAAVETTINENQIMLRSSVVGIALLIAGMFIRAFEKFRNFAPPRREDRLP